MTNRSTYALSAGFALALLGGLPGCGPQSEIRSYTVPAQESAPPSTDRLRALYARSSAGSTAQPKYDVPDSWQRAANDQFSSAAFTAGPSDREARITVTRTGGGMSLDAQLNRWRGQVQLDPISLAEWQEQMETMDMGGVPAAFVVLEGAEQSIAGAVAQHQGLMWFFKMRGPGETVQEQLDQMKAFCRSVRFPAPGGN